MITHEAKRAQHAPKLLSRPLEILISMVALLKDAYARAKAASKAYVGQQLEMQHIQSAILLEHAPERGVRDYGR
jgi:hypothetical protein